MWRRIKELGRFGVMFQVLSTRCHMATMRRFSKIHILSYTLMHTPQSLPISVTQEEWEGLLPILTNLKSEFRYQEKFNVQVRAGKILSDHSEDLSLLRLKSSGSSEIFACKPSNSGSISIKSARALLIGGWGWGGGWIPCWWNALFSMRHPPRDTGRTWFQLLYNRWSFWHLSLEHSETLTVKSQWSQWLLPVLLKVFIEQK